eukprot:3513870-Pyramimonas_sp.AAC.1
MYARDRLIVRQLAIQESSDDAQHASHTTLPTDDGGESRVARESLVHGASPRRPVTSTRQRGTLRGTARRRRRRRRGRRGGTCEKTCR